MKERKKLYSNISGWGMFLAGVLLFTACAEDEIVNNYEPDNNGTGISFYMSKDNNTWEADSRAVQRKQNFVLRSEDSADTLCVSTQTEYGISDVQTVSRGALVTNKDNIKSFGVTSYFYTSTETDAAPAFYYMENEKVEDGINTSKTYYWPPSGNNLSFVAVAPYHELTLPEDQTASATLSYTVPATVANHEDLMVAKTSRINNGSDGTAVPLAFDHILTAIQFAIGETPEGTITSISVSGNMIQGGTYTINSGEWTTKTAAAAATYTISEATTGAGVATETIDSKKIVKDRIITIPQAIAANTLTLTVVFNDTNAGTRTLTASIPAITWAQGTTTTYTISISEAYTLEFTEYTATLDAHYIITTIKFKTDVNWTMRLPEEPEGVTAKAYLSKEKSNTSATDGNKDNEITTNQKAGMWSYVEKCNKNTISGTVATEGEEEDVTVYMLVRENASTTDRTVKVELLKTNEESGKTIDVTQLGYKVYDTTFAMERIEDAKSPFGFTLNVGNVTYKYTAGGLFENFWPYVISSIMTASGSGFTWVGDVLDGPDNITINLTSNVSSITGVDSGLTNTSNASSVTLSQDQNYLISQGWYTTDADIEFSDTQTAFQYCLSKNSYGNFTGDNDDSNGTLSVQWYLPAINEMLKITSQDTGTGANQYQDSYWSSTAINDNTNAYSWSFGATAGTSTARSTSLKIRCARTIN